MKYLKLFEENKDWQDWQYVKDFFIHVGMFIDSIVKTWDDADLYTYSMGSTKIKFFKYGEYFDGTNIFVCELWYNKKDVKGNIPLLFNADNDLFGGELGETPNCIRYIELKIYQELGKITSDNLEKLSKIKFNKDEIDTYLETQKYNI